MRVRVRVAVQFRDHALVQLAQLAGDLPQIVALLPALQSVSGGRFVGGIAGGGRLIGRRLSQFPFEGREESGNVVEQLKPGQRITRGECGISSNGVPPRLQNRGVPRAQIVGKRAALEIDFSHAFLHACPALIA